MRKECEAVLPDKVDDETTPLPLIDMKERCPFTMAFMSEVMRFRSAVPFALPHKAMEDGVIGGMNVPKGTTVLISLHHCMEDEDVWKNAKNFDPQRFIEKETGKFVQRPNTGFLPFSTGRRSCIGEKLAIANMFLIVMRFFQKTRGMRYEVNPAPKTQEDKNLLLSKNINQFFSEPLPFNIRLIDTV